MKERLCGDRLKLPIISREKRQNLSGSGGLLFHGFSSRAANGSALSV
jgi:hypothetical protein